MADKSIFELTLQTTFASNDRLVVGNYANSDAEAITGQTLISLLATSLDGHGGIQSIAKTSSSGSNPVVDTYTITMADSTTTTFSVTNGVKGDTGAQTYVYFRWAHTEPTSWSDTTDQPDEWMGVYAGTATTPPTTVNSYAWVKVQGAKGDTGDAATITTQTVTYQQSTSGTLAPSGTWSETIPTVTPGNFLWTRTQLTFNDGTTITAYSVSRYGIDGSGAVSTVNNVNPDGNGNVALAASDIPTSDSSTVQAHLTDIESDLTSVSNRTSALETAKIPSGGAAGKALVKASSTDYDTAWGDAGGALYFTSVPISAMTGNIATVSNAAITSDYVLTSITFANSSYITSNVTWTTSSGSLVLNGTCTDATTADIVLVLKNN